MIEVKLKTPEDFLKVKETLTRIGVAARETKTLYQSCHILHKRQKYYIVHFKELFILDGRQNTLSEDDIARRNTIAKLISDWGLVELVDPSEIEHPQAPMGSIKVIKHSEKGDWVLEAKYNIGGKK